MLDGKLFFLCRPMSGVAIGDLDKLIWPAVGVTVGIEPRKGFEFRITICQFHAFTGYYLTLLTTVWDWLPKLLRYMDGVTRWIELWLTCVNGSRSK
jgi:hypothetical protein